MSLRAAILLCCLEPSGALGIELDLPGDAVRTAVRTSEAASELIAAGPWQDGSVPSIQAEGPLQRRAWRIETSSRTTLQILAPLRDQLAKAGYDTVFTCKDRTCGGFDFRYSLTVLPEPNMHVDLGDFRYLAARRDSDQGPEFVTLLVSRSSSTGFVQITQIGATVTPVTPVNASTKTDSSATNQSAGQIGKGLLSDGFVVLSDLEFETGSARLGAGSFKTLSDLAQWLQANPDARVTLVGHTDSEGSLAGNLALSKKRAASVRTRLVNDLGVSAAQVAAEGVGFLSPRASNLTDEGRQENRRVEAILTSTR
ncbi:OmpA family protein [Aliiroseovarius sp. PTFE2010]|uniref:OmpA family protein n=1 Tax=Aliiroseovarius sp. PTFE2010 TaxID=3417190 RepID=UPI003CF4D9EE